MKNIKNLKDFQQEHKMNFNFILYLQSYFKRDQQENKYVIRINIIFKYKFN